MSKSEVKGPVKFRMGESSSHITLKRFQLTILNLSG